MPGSRAILMGEEAAPIPGEVRLRQVRQLVNRALGQEDRFRHNKARERLVPRPPIAG